MTGPTIGGALPAKPNGHCGVCRGQKIIDNTVVGQAESILFAMLARVSHDAGRTPLQVAQDFVQTRTLPVTTANDSTGNTCD